VDGIRRVTLLMNDISGASTQQSAGIEQVNLAISHMDEVTQQNAALVEEASAAALSLQDQSEVLAKMVAAFRVAERHDRKDPLPVHAAGKLAAKLVPAGAHQAPGAPTVKAGSKALSPRSASPMRKGSELKAGPKAEARPESTPRPKPLRAANTALATKPSAALNEDEWNEF
jgi:methyl-accepting chemotaxis protein